jgi:hypothetical protein
MRLLAWSLKAQSKVELLIATQCEHKIVDYSDILVYLLPELKKRAEVAGI